MKELLELPIEIMEIRLINYFLKITLMNHHRNRQKLAVEISKESQGISSF